MTIFDTLEEYYRVTNYICWIRLKQISSLPIYNIAASSLELRVLLDTQILVIPYCVSYYVNYVSKFRMINHLEWIGCNIIRKQVNGQRAVCSTKRGHARSLVSGAARSRRRAAGATETSVS